jgi:hypothetical protein
MMMEQTEDREMLGENLPRATLSTTDPTKPDVGSSPSRRGAQLASNQWLDGDALHARF